ncbi:uncharacterized protein [Typha angustifolia]|uniref:uncharacterized protein n=1 Tax=Typha angustifolia TaxID=59011 RepID=UPI003C2E299A
MDIGKNQVPYSRKRDHPQFQGMRRSVYTSSSERPTLESQAEIRSSCLPCSLSDTETKQTVQKTYNDDIAKVVEPASKSSLERVQSMTTDRRSNSEEDKSVEELKSTNSGKGKNTSHPKIYLPHSAASFYSGNLLPTDTSVLGMCPGIQRLNQYMKYRKADIKAGVPGKFLQAVIGQEIADVGSIASTIMYAFFLNETQISKQLCTVPIINISRTDFNTHAELKWLLRSCRVEEINLVFVDEVDLSSYKFFGNLKIVLLNGDKLPVKQEGLKDALVDIFNRKQDSTCCTLVAEKFAETMPEILAGQGFSRLLLSGILLDTADLKNPSCTPKDKYITTLLINGAGRYGCDGLYQMLKYKMFDITDLKVRDILLRDFKKWTRVAGKPSSTGSRLTVSNIGMSSIGISVKQLLAREDSAAKEVVLFKESQRLQLLIVVSGYYDFQKIFKRDILVCSSSAELMRNFLHFFNTNCTNLPLKVLDQLDLIDELRAFEIDNKLTSRRSIERVLEEFGGVLRKQ